MIYDMSYIMFGIPDLMISWHASMISASDDGPRRKIDPPGVPEFSGVPNRDPLLDHVTVRNDESHDVTTDVSLCRQRDRHSKHPRNDVDRLNPIRPTHCGRDACTRPGRVSGVHRYQPIPGPESPSVNSVSFSPGCIQGTKTRRGYGIRCQRAIPVAGGS